MIYWILYQVTEETNPMTFTELQMYAMFYEQNGRGWKIPTAHHWLHDNRLVSWVWYERLIDWGDTNYVQLVRLRPPLYKLVTLFSKIKRAKENSGYQLFKRVINFFNVAL